MADSFADLWATSAPIKQPPKLGASTVPKSNPSAQRSQWDSFSVLSASQPTTRNHSPHTSHQQAQVKPAVTSSQRQNTTDAFSELFDASMGLGSGAGNSGAGNMSIAQRAALAQKMKLEQLQQQKGEGSTALNSAIPPTWDGLDSLAQANTGFSNKSLPQGDFDFAFGDAKPTQQTNHTVIADDDDWGLSEFTSPQPAAQSKVQPKSPSLWDLDEIASPPPTQSPPSQTGTPGSFEFGDRRDRDDGVLDGNPQDDDILGVLGKPANHNARASPPLDSAPVPRHEPSPRATTASPPPHILGQLVEMGFAPQLALTALLSTSTADDFDVQAALDWLLAHREAVSMSEPSGDHLDEYRDREREHQTPRGPPNRAARHSERRGAQPTQPQSDAADFPASAERLISQAGEISRGVFNRANALFKEGKEKAMKIYEERTGTTSTRLAGGKDAGSDSSDGRPRWMRDNPVEEGDVHGSFTDRDNGDECEFKPRSNGSSRKSPNNVLAPPPTQEVDLFSSDSPPVVYQSPFRRGRSKPESIPTSSSSDSFTGSSSRLPPSRPPRMPPRRLTATIPSTIFTTYTSQKSAGADAYKLGQYPAAADAYSRALAPIPEGHVLRLPLLTNRAAARSKVGELSGAGEDCSAAISLVEELVGNISAGSEKIGRVRVVIEAPGSTDKDTEVDLACGLTKAYQRRAEAYEGLEKWAPALADWEVLVGADWAGASRALAPRGAARCRQMIGNALDGTMSAEKRPVAPSNIAQQPPKPRPKARMPPTSLSTGDSPAVAALRAAANVAASEDAERHVHKDAVDGRLLAWRQGKEANIRALLTTLDGILWPELGWKKVGMAEVVGKGQVKVAYMRAIARVHPDKLNASNTTVEQRMIANGVFGTLNEAWNAFLQQ